jgi:hypothetical protein
MRDVIITIRVGDGVNRFADSEVKSIAERITDKVIGGNPEMRQNTVTFFVDVKEAPE